MPLALCKQPLSTLTAPCRSEAAHTRTMEDHPRLPASVQVLANTDILYGIFTLIDLEPNVRLKNLLGCVTVCRTFCESANRFL